MKFRLREVTDWEKFLDHTPSAIASYAHEDALLMKPLCAYEAASLMKSGKPHEG